MFDLKALPYDPSEFGDFISERTFSFHHGKHLGGYVNNLNKLVKDSEFEGKDLEFIIKNSKGAVFNNAAQIYNHEFYFNCLSPKKQTIDPKLEACIKEDIKDFKAEFIAAAAGVFGSGWAWLVFKNGHFEILTTPNANTPIEQDGCFPLLVVDVWEHAYYLDHQNLRPRYLEQFCEYINWDFVNERLKLAKSC